MKCVWGPRMIPLMRRVCVYPGLRIVGTFLVAVTLADASPTAAVQQVDQFAGFRGQSFGAALSQEDFVEVDVGHDAIACSGEMSGDKFDVTRNKAFRRRKEKLLLGDIPLLRIDYYAYEGRFVGVRIVAKEKSLGVFQEFEATLEAMFGAPSSREPMTGANPPLLTSTMWFGSENESFAGVSRCSGCRDDKTGASLDRVDIVICSNLARRSKEESLRQRARDRVRDF